MSKTILVNDLIKMRNSVLFLKLKDINMRYKVENSLENFIMKLKIQMFYHNMLYEKFEPIIEKCLINLEFNKKF